MYNSIFEQNVLKFSLVFLHVDHSKGFGGKFGVQKDRVDKVNKITKYMYMDLCNFVHVWPLTVEHPNLNMSTFQFSEDLHLWQHMDNKPITVSFFRWLLAMNMKGKQKHMLHKKVPPSTLYILNQTWREYFTLYCKLYILEKIDSSFLALKNF